jgi:hypothetical protein
MEILGNILYDGVAAHLRRCASDCWLHDLLPTTPGPLRKASLAAAGPPLD